MINIIIINDQKNSKIGKRQEKIMQDCFSFQRFWDSWVRKQNISKFLKVSSHFYSFQWATICLLII